jgi:hypothetical protein
MAESITVTITIDERRVTLEGPPDFVRAEVQRLTDALASIRTGLCDVPRQVQEASDKVLSESQLIAIKEPSNHAEIVAVLAYCLREREGVTDFSEEDIKRAYLRARVRPPKVVGQAIRDAKNLFDYIEQGSGRGNYRLSHHGERTVVFDLPRERKKQG